MSLELVAEVLLGVLVFGGLAFGNRVVDRLASMGTDPDLLRPDDLK